MRTSLYLQGRKDFEEGKTHRDYPKDVSFIDAANWMRGWDDALVESKRIKAAREEYDLEQSVNQILEARGFTAEEIQMLKSYFRRPCLER